MRGLRSLLLTVAIGLLGAPSRAESVRPSNPPNLVFILADDLGYGDLGCYGQTVLATPRLDRMAAEGLRFTQHYAGSTVCAPSRACLLTGQHTGHVHQRANGKLSFRADPLDRCVASALRDAGYATAMIGQSGLACQSKDPLLPRKKGFEHFFGFLGHGAAHRYYPRLLWEDGERVSYPSNRGKEGKRYSGDLFLGDTLAWLEEHAGQPFFLHLALQQPHLDLNAPPAWRERYVNSFEETPIPEGHYRGETHPKATFAAMVAYLDDTVGQVMDKLAALGVEHNTLVLFSSDNGPVSSGGWSAKNFNSGGPLRGHKRDLYEGGVRVPLIARWPGRIKAGGVTDHVSAHWDFAPTACELAGCDLPWPSDGVSYAPTLFDQGTQPQHDHLYWEFYEQGGKQAVRCGDWKAVRLRVLKAPDTPIELYDLSADPAEQRDIAEEHPAIVRRLALLMKTAHEPNDLHRLSAPIETREPSWPRKRPAVRGGPRRAPSAPKPMDRGHRRSGPTARAA